MLTACGTTARLSGNSGGGSGLDVTGQSGGTSTAGGGSTSGPAGGTGTAANGGGLATGTAGGSSAGQGTGLGNQGVASGAGGGSNGAPSIGSPGGPATGTGTSTASHVPGVTATTITIGFPYAVETSAANAAIGANGISQGPTQGEAQAMINYINQHGGVGGRKIIPVWYQENAVSFSSIDASYQGECQQFEVDSHVFAIFDGQNPIILQCAQQAGAVAIDDNISLDSQPTYAKYPPYFELNSPDLNRIAFNEVQGLNAQKWFSPWDANLSRAGATKAKVGVVTFSSPDFDYALNKSLLPALSQIGYAPASGDVIQVASPQTTSDISSVGSAVSSAVLKLRADGVDHVVIFDGNGDLTLFFLNDASGQHYYPRYGVNSQNGPEILASSGDVPTAEMNGALGIGWDPILDLASAQDPDNGPYSNPARRACLALMTSKGYSASDNNAETVQIGICSVFSFLQTVAQAVSGPLNQASFVAAASRLGYWNGAGDALGNFFGPTQHDGGAYYRAYDWVNSCGCMEYIGANVKAVGEGET